MHAYIRFGNNDVVEKQPSDGADKSKQLFEEIERFLFGTRTGSGSATRLLDGPADLSVDSFHV